MKIKTIDWYIFKKYLGTFFYLLLLFLAIAIIIDITEKIDDFIEHQIPVTTIFTDYYVHFIPWIGLLLSPVFVFVAVIFFTSRLSSNTEITCMLTGGISFYRLLVPYMAAALFLTLLFYYCNHFLLPKSNLARIDFEQKYVISGKSDRDRNLHVQIAKDSLIYMQNFRAKDSVGYKFTLEYLEDKNMRYKLSADKVTYLGEEEGWVLTNWIERMDVGEFEKIREV